MSRLGGGSSLNSGPIEKVRPFTKLEEARFTIERCVARLNRTYDKKHGEFTEKRVLNALKLHYILIFLL